MLLNLNADNIMYSKVAFDEYLCDDPEELGEINLPCPVEENDETGRAKKMLFHELEVCSDDTVQGSAHTGQERSVPTTTQPFLPLLTRGEKC